MPRVSLLVLVFVLSSATALATPTRLSQQGRVLDGAGGPLSGSHTLVFTLYDEETGGNVLWTETHQLNLDEGYYSVTLGTLSTLDDLLFDGGAQWLQLTLNGDDLSPRQEVISVPYAMRSTSATHLDGGLVDAAEVHVGGVPVIDSSANWIGPTPSINWSDLNNVPAGLADGDTDTQLTEAQVDAFVANNNYSVGEHTVDTDTQLTEAQVDTFVANNNYSVGEHTVDTDTQLTEAQVDAFVANNNYSVGEHTVDTDTQLTEAQVEDYITNDPIALSDDLTVGTATFKVDASTTFVGIGTSDPVTHLNVAASAGGGAPRARLSNHANDAEGGALQFTKSRDTTIGGHLQVQSGDELGSLIWYSSDGQTWEQSAKIRAEVDGTPGTNDVPGRLTFYTTADGTVSPSERMRINQAGQVGIGTPSPSEQLTVAGVVESTSGGFKFPDGTTQTTASSTTSGGAGTVIYTRCAWTGASADTIGNCSPQACPSGWQDLGGTGNIKTATSQGVSTHEAYQESGGYQERMCYLESTVVVSHTRCAWTGASADTVGNCSPQGCPSGWQDLGVTGNIKTAISQGVSTHEAYQESAGYQERTCIR
ncbi:MAG: hypothetical protein CL928_06105 [Deltaproteobacteria bacterium]|nr:hypothetical protein [Deltaproteobacteria bacterium]